MTSTTAAAVATSAGIVRGTCTADGVRAFHGIPYAAATTGAHRFAPPQAAEPWTGERDATRPGALASRVSGGEPLTSRPGKIIGRPDWLAALG